jgi:hypothetical protein
MGNTSRRPIKKQLLTSKIMKTRLQWAKKYNNWNSGDLKKVMFTDETHFFVKASRKTILRRSHAEPLRTGHLQQTVKHPPKKMFWECFTSTEPESLVPIEGMINSENDSDIIKR